MVLTSLRKVQFQQFQHYSVANRKVYQLICLTNKIRVGQICSKLAEPWINVHAPSAIFVKI